MLPSGAPFSVVNMGIGSNRLVSADAAGPSAVSTASPTTCSPGRTSGYLVVLEGINDISYEHASSATITAAYANLVAQAHAAGITVYGATLLPIGNSSKYTAANEATRQAVNAWIRTPGNFDAVLDFEAVVKDPATNPLRIKSSLTCDFVHPNAAGYSAIGNSIPSSPVQLTAAARRRCSRGPSGAARSAELGEHVALEEAEALPGQFRAVRRRPWGGTSRTRTGPTRAARRGTRRA